MLNYPPEKEASGSTQMPQPLPDYGPQGMDTSLDTGFFEGVTYRVEHRDTNTVLHLTLQPGYDFKSQPNMMLAMTSDIKMSGHFKLGFKQLLGAASTSVATYQGPGEVILAPHVWSDIKVIKMDGNQMWNIGRGYLGSTTGISWNIKSQGLKKALFSGDGLFVAECFGAGLLFVEAFGALTTKHLRQGEEYIIDRGHLVAWNCKYKMEKLNTGGFMSRLASGEWFVCRFTGPGTIYLQTRNPEHFVEWIAARLPSG